MDREDLRERLLVAHQDGNPALTIEIGKRYLAKYPDDGTAFTFVGMAMQGVARYADARAAYEQALAIMPTENHFLIYRQIGLLEQDLSNVSSAETWFRRALDARPDDATSYIYLGALLAKNGRLDEAEACHRRGTTCSEGCIDEAYLNLGHVLLAKEDYLGALHCYREALERDPLDHETQKAIEDMEQLLFHFPAA
jgi:tetratricopeptide (TPR) repeat protein